MIFLSLGMSGNILKARADNGDPVTVSGSWVRQNAEITWSNTFDPLVWNNAQQTNTHVSGINGNPDGIGNDNPTVYAYIYDPGSGYDYIYLGLEFYHTSQALNNWQTVDMADSMNVNIYHSNYVLFKPYGPYTTSGSTSSISYTTTVDSSGGVSMGISESFNPTDVQILDHSDVNAGQVLMDWEYQILLGSNAAKDTYNLGDYVVLQIPRSDIAPYTQTYCAQRYWIDGHWVCYKWASYTVYPTIDLLYSESASYQSTADLWALWGVSAPSNVYTHTLSETWSFIPQDPIGVNI